MSFMKVKKYLVNLYTPINTNSKTTPPEDYPNASGGIYDA